MDSKSTIDKQWEINSKKHLAIRYTVSKILVSHIQVSYEKRSVEIPWYHGPLKRDSVNSNDRRYIEDQIWGHPSKTGSAQPRGGRGRRNPNIYSYFLRNSNHTQRRGRSENANFDRASLMDSPKGAFIKDVRPKLRFLDPPPFPFGLHPFHRRTSVFFISYWMRSPHTHVYSLKRRVRRC